MLNLPEDLDLLSKAGYKKFTITPFSDILDIHDEE